MPELPEVETVKRELSRLILGKTFSSPVLYYKPLIKTDCPLFLEDIKGKEIISIKRKGKFLIFHLSENKKLIFHLRMEGKIFIENIENHSFSHLSMFIPFEDDENGLAFYDVRKFGCIYYLDEEEEGPLLHVGKEPFNITVDELYQLYNTKDECIKVLLMNQSLMSGIGNIYADEILFASQISPFKKGNMLTKEEISALLENARKILLQAIESKGSTVRSYKASEHVKGSFQQFLKVYSREGKECLCCHKAKIEKRKLGGRGTSYCPICQHTGINVAITGKIASGKSLASHYFEVEGFRRLSSDEEVHKLYADSGFIKELEEKFPKIFIRHKLSKAKITALLAEDKSFKRKYEAYIFKAVKERINRFIIENDGENKIIEVPLLFDAHMEHDFTYIIGIETTRQEEHLQERGEDVTRKNFNALNSYDLHHDELDFILHSDGTKEELHDQVKALIEKITD